jgi:hypothetical protein
MLRSSVSQLATTNPKVPPPMMTKSYSASAIFLISSNVALGNASLDIRRTFRSE